MNRAPAPDISATQFPVLEQAIYADHAAISPWPQVTMNAVIEFAEENCSRGPLDYRRCIRREKKLRRLLARMLNAESPGDIALLKNTTEGICMVVNGIGWRPGDNVVTAAGEFASNHMAWAALADRGVALREVDIRSADSPEAALLDAMDERTRVLSVSSVQWDDGFRLSLPFLGQACRNSGVLFFVDAIQHFGALRLDVRVAAIDCLSAGAHKWQMGPEGIAAFYCSARARETLRLSEWGWRMVDQPFRLDGQPQAPSATARRFETGSPNNMGQAALLASLELLHQYGEEEVERRVLENSRQLAAGIGSIPGLRIISSTDAPRRSGIVGFSSAAADPLRFLAGLKGLGVVAARRGAGIRLSPHFYQQASHIEALLEAIEITENKLK